MERDDRPPVAPVAPVATFFSEGVLNEPAVVELPEGVAHHARVKRLREGDAIRLTNGAGTIASATLERIGRSGCTAAVRSSERVPPQRAIHLRPPVADRERMLLLAEKATELGIASWQAIRWSRSMSVSPRGEGAVFRAKIQARIIAALEQSGGAWLPTILGDADAESIDRPPETLPLLLDADGEPIMGIGGTSESTVLFGPEGG
ncbi:MAG TPA: RsmE family RNA methyltransferase, partial [Gemmatimonadaceae bacterium]|nr:RsmE family RNA methyltransferase [Gemmatimonadaceae bacterium]